MYVCILYSFVQITGKDVDVTFWSPTVGPKGSVLRSQAQSGQGRTKMDFY